MLVFGDSLEIKYSSLARLCDTYWCNFVREHGIGGNMESLESLESLESVESVGSVGSAGSAGSVGSVGFSWFSWGSWGKIVHSYELGVHGAIYV